MRLHVGLWYIVVMNFNTQENPKIETVSVRETLNRQADIFLGEEKKIIGHDVFSRIIDDTEKEISIVEKSTGLTMEYDKYKKKFKIGKEEGLSIGSIVSARRWGIYISLPENINQSGEENKLNKIINTKKMELVLNSHLNKELAERLAEINRKKDAMVAIAYEKIAERTGIESKQLGVMAEQIIIGVLEGISIDRSDLGFEVIEANAYQDVNNKIDFIVATKHKNRGVGVNKNEVSFEEKSIGVQFTTNISKGEHKADQIAKAKSRGVEVDDIVYVEMDQKILREAVSKWEKEGKEIAGPWKFLSPEIRKQILSNLLGGLLDEEQKKSLIKNEN